VQKTAAELQLVSTQAALAAGGIKPELVDSVVFGNVLSVSFILPAFSNDVSFNSQVLSE